MGSKIGRSAQPTTENTTSTGQTSQTSSGCPYSEKRQVQKPNLTHQNINLLGCAPGSRLGSRICRSAQPTTENTTSTGQISQTSSGCPYSEKRQVQKRNLTHQNINLFGCAPGKLWQTGIICRCTQPTTENTTSTRRTSQTSLGRPYKKTFQNCRNYRDLENESFLLQVTEKQRNQSPPLSGPSLPKRAKESCVSVYLFIY